MANQGHRHSEKQRTREIPQRMIAEKDNEPSIEKSRRNGDQSRAAVQQKKACRHRQQKGHVTTRKVPGIFPQMQPLFDVREKTGHQQRHCAAGQECRGALTIRKPDEAAGHENTEQDRIHRIRQSVPLLRGHSGCVSAP